MEADGNIQVEIHDDIKDISEQICAYHLHLKLMKNNLKEVSFVANEFK